MQVRLRDFELHRPRQWGACWLFTLLWKELGLEEFWRPQLGCSREGTHWEHVLQSAVLLPVAGSGQRVAAAPGVVRSLGHGRLAR